MKEFLRVLLKVLLKVAGGIVGFFAVLALVVVIGVHLYTPPVSIPQKTVEEIKTEKIQDALGGLSKIIKESMHNPSSYEHVETRYIDKKDQLIVTTKFRGTNAFGGVVTNTVIATIDLNSRKIEIVSGI